MLRHSSTLLAALTLLLVPARSRAAQPGEIRAGSLPRNAETLLLMENAGNAGKLRPEVFRRLSSAGQRAVLRAAGLLPPPAARAMRAPLAGGVRRPLTPSPGQNVRVNDPTTDFNGHTQSESSIAAHGGNIIVGFQDANEENVSAFGLSTDGGSTFQQQSLPEAGQNLGDPVVAFGPNGECRARVGPPGAPSEEVARTGDRPTPAPAPGHSISVGKRDTRASSSGPRRGRGVGAKTSKRCPFDGVWSYKTVGGESLIFFVRSPA